MKVKANSPWPERVGCEGVIVEKPKGEAGRLYPWHGLGRNEVVVLLDDDPLAHRGGTGFPYSWTCVIGRNCLDVLDG